MKKSTKVTSGLGLYPGGERITVRSRDAGSAEAGCCRLAERLDRSTFLQELETGGDDFVSRLEAGDDRICIANSFAESDGNLVGNIAITLLRGYKDEGLATDERD